MIWSPCWENQDHPHRFQVPSWFSCHCIHIHFQTFFTNLGIIFDQHLSWNYHISLITRNAIIITYIMTRFPRIKSSFHLLITSLSIKKQLWKCHLARALPGPPGNTPLKLICLERMTILKWLAAGRTCSFLPPSSPQSSMKGA